MKNQGESEVNIEKHEETWRIKGKHRKPRGNRTSQDKTQKTTRKHGESVENLEKHKKPGRIREKHRKTRETPENQGKT